MRKWMVSYLRILTAICLVRENQTFRWATVHISLIKTSNQNLWVLWAKFLKEFLTFLLVRPLSPHIISVSCSELVYHVTFVFRTRGRLQSVKYSQMAQVAIDFSRPDLPVKSTINLTALIVPPAQLSRHSDRPVSSVWKFMAILHSLEHVLRPQIPHPWLDYGLNV